MPPDMIATPWRVRPRTDLEQAVRLEGCALSKKEHAFIDALVRVETRFLGDLAAQVRDLLPATPASRQHLELVLIGGVLRRRDAHQFLARLHSDRPPAQLQLHVTYAVSAFQLLCLLLQLGRSKTRGVPNLSVDVSSEEEAPPPPPSRGKRRNAGIRTRVQPASSQLAAGQASSSSNSFSEREEEGEEDDALSSSTASSSALDSAEASRESKGSAQMAQMLVSSVQMEVPKVATKLALFYEQRLAELVALCSRLQSICVYVSEIELVSTSTLRAWIKLLAHVQLSASVPIRIVGGVVTTYTSLFGKLSNELHALVRVQYYALGSTESMLARYFKCVEQEAEETPSPILQEFLRTQSAIISAFRSTYRPFLSTLRFLLYKSTLSCAALPPFRFIPESSIDGMHRVLGNLFAIVPGKSLSVLSVFVQCCLTQKFGPPDPSACRCQRCIVRSTLCLLYSFKRLGLLKLQFKTRKVHPPKYASFALMNAISLSRP
eukprot:Gregarina_sp_Pseudo_9__1214@NODE_17_length_6116_cov_22_397400_g15_i0_p2_GENE_NODE_17_length_6116_cov_22_397400_g15_i0NODE_17_length_6116_cov_22_397400_g15_i0_p2_ORF_typecomplete_len491_score150_31ORC3_N/PF07034_11/0_017_NODE_17_length_6116_cov_22_397400_g15_i013492821